MKAFTSSLSMVRFARWALACVLLAALQGPVLAQDTSQLPLAPLQQTLAPQFEEEWPNGLPPAGQSQETSFGLKIARHGNTALIYMERFHESTGRVAVFTRNASGTWERTGSLDPPNGQPGDQFGNTLALDAHAALIGSNRALHVYRRHGPQGFTLIQTLRNANGRSFSAGALWHGWAFVPSSDNGDRFVRVYRFTPRGLFLTQKLRSGEPSTDGFADDMAFSDGTLLVGAPGDDEGRGAAYLFEPHHGLFWIKRQKLIATDGAPGDSFGQTVALANGVIAIGAPGVQIDTQPGVFCGEGNYPYYFGNVDIFRRAPGHLWSERQALPAPLCIWGFGESLATNGKWIVVGMPAPGIFQSAPSILYRRDDSGQYTAAAIASTTMGQGAPALHLRGSTLMVGLRTERNFEVGDIGSVDVYLLDK